MKSISRIVNEAETLFLTATIAGHPEASMWVMQEMHREGHPQETIAQTIGTSVAAVHAIVGGEYDEDELPDRPGLRRCTTRMLPIAGPRRDCRNESACLDELLRACRPHAPREASCPPDCPSYTQPEPVPPDLGLGEWAA